jgi:hypothetical protein
MENREAMAMDDYLGIVVRESLRDSSLIPPVVASRRGADWTLLLVRIPVEELGREVAALRSNLDRTDCWYAHFFREDELVVVFDDEVFRVSTDPGCGSSSRERSTVHQRDLDTSRSWRLVTHATLLPPSRRGRYPRPRRTGIGTVLL